MIKPDITKAKNKALEVIKKYKLTEIPVKMSKILLEEEIGFEQYQYKEDTKECENAKLGFFDVSCNKIKVNNEYGDKVMLFTLAHELGHYFLHKDVLKNDKIKAFYRKSFRSKEKEEVEANVFAANLLVPEKPFIKYYKRFEDVEKLSIIFAVSPSVIRARRETIIGY